MPRILATEPLTGVPATQPLTSAAGRWSIWLAVAAFAVLWVDVIRQLSSEWSTRDQYAYGWFVPFLGIGLFLKRWMNRPEPSRPINQSGLFHAALVLSITAVFLPLRVIWEVNPDWPLCSWLVALITVALTLYGVYSIGGRSWLAYFSFPICFILVSVSWPNRIEKSLTQGLMQLVGNITVEILGWINIPALQRGNLIDLASTTVGVDEACSGIRSFQSTLMGALFLGELYLLRVRPRLLLVLCALFMAFLLNVVRTLLLSWQAAKGGVAALHNWHDPAGLTIAVACFICVWLVAVAFSRQSGPPAGSQPSKGPLGETFRAPIGLCLAIVLLAATVVVGKEVWYRYHEAIPFNYTRWSVSMPAQANAYRESPLPKDQLDALKCDLNQGYIWEESGAHWSVWWFRWDRQSLKSLVGARCHKPETCLPASGRKLKANLGMAWYPVGSLNLPFRRLVFENGAEPLYVFFCLWQDGTEQFPRLDNLSIAGRLSAAANGRRLLGQQTLELIGTGFNSFEEADAAFRARLPELVRIDH